jgi:hypothetical protein
MVWRRSTPSNRFPSERSLEIAERAAAAYAATGKVCAVLVAGSVARDTADRFSDLELDVYWGQTPMDVDRYGVIETLGASDPIVWPYAPADAEWAENFHLDGVEVGVSGFLASWLTVAIADVTAGGDPDLDKQMRLAAVNDGIVLIGEGRVDKWRAQSTRYPPALAVAVASNYLDPSRLGRWHQRHALIARDEAVLLRACIPPVVEMILGALCAVNSVLIAHPAFKWTDHLIRQLTIAPAGLHDALWTIANGPAAEAVGVVDSLLAETIAIVEDALPDVPLAHLRRELVWGRASV